MKQIFKATAFIAACFCTAAPLHAEEHGGEAFLPRQTGQPVERMTPQLPAAWRGDLSVKRILDWSRPPAVSGTAAGVPGLPRFAGDRDGSTLQRKNILKYLVAFHKHNGDIMVALNYQIRLLKEFPTGPETMESISEYRELLGLRNQKADPVIEEAIPEDPRDIAAIRRQFFGKTDDRLYHEKLAEYYFSTLNFDEAREQIALALNQTPAKSGFFGRKEEAPPVSLHRLLRNICLLEGDFSLALQENRWLVENAADAMKANDLSIDAFLKEIRNIHLSPLDIRYKADSAGFRPVIKFHAASAGREEHPEV